MQRQWFWGLGLAIMLELSGCGADSVAEGDEMVPLKLGKADVTLSDGSAIAARDWVDLDVEQATVTLEFAGEREEVAIADIETIEFETLDLPSGDANPSIRGEDLTLALAAVKLDTTTLRVPEEKFGAAGVTVSDGMVLRQLEFAPTGESWQVTLEVGSQP